MERKSPWLQVRTSCVAVRIAVGRALGPGEPNRAGLLMLISYLFVFFTGTHMGRKFSIACCCQGLPVSLLLPRKKVALGVVLIMFIVPPAGIGIWPD